MANRSRVLLDVHASADEAEAVGDILRAAGIDADVSVEWREPPPARPDRGGGQVGDAPYWMVLLALGVPIGSFLKSFGETLGREAGEAAWATLKRLVDALNAAREGGLSAWGLVEIEDSEGTMVNLADLPDDAYRALLGLDWSQYRGRRIVWSSDRKEWVDRDLPPA